MWDYVPTRFLFSKTRGGMSGVGFGRPWLQGIDRVDPSPPNRQIKHVPEIKLSGCDRRLTCCHMALFRAWIFLEWTTIAARVDRAIKAIQPTWLHRSNGHVKRDSSLFVKIAGASDFDQMATWSAICPSSWRSVERRIPIRQRRQLVEELHYRGPIKPQSWRDWGDFAVESLLVERTAIDESLAPRSTPDRGPIMARSWQNRGKNHGKNWSKIVA